MVALSMPASAQQVEPGNSPPSRGRLLYQTHCIGCHTTQMHWRDRKLATDWNRLVALVGEWQDRQRLAWSPDDVLEVARHLNETIYRHARPTERGAAEAPAVVANR